MTDINEDIQIAGSVTLATDAWHGAVLIAGSHGGVYAAYCAVKAGVKAVILNDAGRGLNNAGVAGGAYCDALGVPYAAVDTLSARIGDGRDMADRGRISYVNEAGEWLGVRVGTTALDAARLLKKASAKTVEAPAYQEAREVREAGPSGRRLVLMDSASLVREEDAGQVVVTGSHGGLPSPDPFSAIKADVYAAFFHDAGIGADEAGIGRLPHLDARGIIGGTVAAASAEIGNARSVLENGVLSRINSSAERAGGSIGMKLSEFAATLIA